MRQHFVIWSVAVALLAVALGFGTLRSSVISGGLTAAVAIDQALLLLEHDRAAADAATQDAIRAAAALSRVEGVANAESAYLTALQYQRERNVPGAELYFKRAIAMRPDWSDPRTGLGWLLGVHALGREAEAEEALLEAIRLDPEDSRPHITLTILYRYEERMEEAETHAREALRLEPDSVTSHNSYANLMIRRGAYEEAETHYRRALEIDPENSKPHYNLACLYSITGRTEEALSYLAEACEMDPAYRRQAINDNDLDGIRSEAAFQRIIYGADAGDLP